ncbi:MAG: hypothetical protein V1647_03605 [Pseudomonadota bacterium]
MFKRLLTALFIMAAMPSTVKATDVTVGMGVYAKIAITVTANMVIPTVYTNTTGTLTSEDTSSIPGGLDGVNAGISLTGEPSKQYSLSFSDTTIITNATDNVTVTLSMGTGGGNKTGRTFSGAGTDSTTIKGSVTLTGTRSRGTYNNNTSPLVVTATYDDV